MQVEPQIAFRADPGPPVVEVRVNFGILAGRKVTPAEIDELALMLRPDVDHVAIVSEVRHEIGRDTEAAVHLVRIEVEREHEELVSTIVDTATFWARMCAAERQAGV